MITEHVPGKPKIFFVFQGKTFDYERGGGYIWAPIKNKDDKTFNYWDKLLDVRFGDIILHGSNGRVVAISTAHRECYEGQAPDEINAERMWEREGRFVDCDYIVMQNPIRTADYKDDVIKFSNAKYSPFNKHGNGNQGYLYEINRELARIFIQESAKRNKYLLNYDYVNNFLKEKND